MMLAGHISTTTMWRVQAGGDQITVKSVAR